MSAGLRLLGALMSLLSLSALAIDRDLALAATSGWLQVSQVGGPESIGSAAPETVETLLYSVSINGQPQGTTLLLRLSSGKLLAAEADWARWHLIKPTDVAYDFEGDRYYACNAAPGFAVAFDEPKLEAQLTFAPQAFATTRISAAGQRAAAPQPPPGLGGFLNYDFVGTRQEIGSVEPTHNIDGAFELGAFNGLGVGTSQWLGTNLSDEDPEVRRGRRFIRLDSAWTRDLAEDMETIRIGDGVGASGIWGRPLRYGGLRWSRNFGTQPGYVTLPQPAFAGETALPSVLDVYVDGVRRQSLEVPAGPFQVDDVPTMTGLGEVQLVVRDLLGREQVLTESYITGARQLRAGLQDFSLESGFVREHFGRESNEYGDALLSATHRYGLSDGLTSEVRAEGSTKVQAVGIGSLFSIAPLGSISTAFVVSHADSGIGTLNSLSFQRTRRRSLNFGARMEFASADFAQLGLSPDLGRARRVLGANLGFSLQPLGSFGAGYIQQRRGSDGAQTAAVNASFTHGFRRGSLNLTAIERLEPSRDYTIAATLRFPFGPLDSGSLGYRNHDGENSTQSAETFARLQRNLPADEGFGYRVAVSETHGETLEPQTRGEAGAFLNAPRGSYSLEASTYSDINTYRAGASGGFGALAGHAFASRKITASFGIVEADAQDIELLVNNRVAGRTDRNGVAVLPLLYPYQANSVHVNTAQLPLNVELDTDEYQAVPYFRSGVLISIEARVATGAVVTFQKADGSAIPSGAVVTLDNKSFPVGKHGQAYLANLSPGPNAVEVRWNGSRCTLVFDLPESHDYQPQLGPFQCPADH